MQPLESADDPQSWIDAWLDRCLPAASTERSRAEAEAHYLAFRDGYGPLLPQLEAAHSALVELVAALEASSKEQWQNPHIAQFLLLHHNASSFESAARLLGSGFYNDAIAVTRSAYETLIRMLWVGCFPDVAFNVLVHSPGRGEKSFNLTGFLRDELRFDWAKIYSVLSTFAHSNSFPTLKAVSELATGSSLSAALERPREFDAGRVAAITPLLQFTLLGHIRVGLDCLAENSVLPPGSAQVAAREAHEFLEFVVRGSPILLWALVAADLDEAFRFIRMESAGDDWNREVQKREVVERR